MKARASRFWAWASHQTVLFAAVVALAAVASSAAAGCALKPGTVEPRTVTVPRSAGPLATKKLADEVGRGLPAPTQPAMALFERFDLADLRAIAAASDPKAP